MKAPGTLLHVQHQRCARTLAPIGRRDGELVDVTGRMVERDKARHSACATIEGTGDLNTSGCHCRQMVDEPNTPRLEIDAVNRSRPRTHPKVCEFRKVGGNEWKELVGQSPYCAAIRPRGRGSGAGGAGNAAAEASA